MQITSIDQQGTVYKFSTLMFDGVYAEKIMLSPCFNQIKAPDPKELAALVHTTSHPDAIFLERKGMLMRDDENSYLQLDATEEDSMEQFHGHSIVP